MKYTVRRFGSKWTKTQWLLGDHHIAPYVPRTERFNKENLERMMELYRTVYMKPFNGYGGRGIIRIKRLDDRYEVQRDRKVYSHSTLESLYAQLQSLTGKKNYLLQKGIDLKRAGGRPFDLRVMVQKDQKGRWSTTGVFAKIGLPGKVVNNYQQGGRIAFLSETLARAGYTPSMIKKVKLELEELGERVGRCFDRHKKGFRELGLDVAIDRSDRLWILEVNTKPAFYPLKKMKDKSMYNRMLRYAKQYRK